MPERVGLQDGRGGRRVNNDYRSPRTVRFVRAGAVKQQRMEEENAARLQFDMDPLEQRFKFGHPLKVRSCLPLAYRSMVDATQFVRAAEDLQTAVFGGCLVKGDDSLRLPWVDKALVIIVAVVLMPLPGAAGTFVLQYHLPMIEGDFFAKQDATVVGQSRAAAEARPQVVG